MICAAPACAAASATVAPSAHHAEYVRLIEPFNELLHKDPNAAVVKAGELVRQVRQLAGNDQRRADALELLARACMGVERYREALPLAAEVVRIRRLADPADQELLALALDLNGTILFAVDRFEEADASFRESLLASRQAFAGHDLRLAQALENHAEGVQKGFGRTRYVVELLREAIALREAHPADAPGKRAETLEELAIHELREDEYSAADGHLADAVTLIRGEIARQPEREEASAGLAQMLVMRAGIAARLARKDEAQRLAREAGALQFTDRVLRAENESLVATSLTLSAELSDDLDAAIAEQLKLLDGMDRYEDLFASGALDRNSIADTGLWLGQLYLKKDELDLAREMLTIAHRLLGETSDVLFSLAELERRSGHDAIALTHYQAALRTRKENATEMTVFFGTSRTPLSSAPAGRFGTQATAAVSLGSAAVLVPGAQFSEKTWLRAAAELTIPAGRATDASHLLIRSKQVLDEAQFRVRAREQMARSRLYAQSALVFVHGFNVSFDQALQRGAQLARDLNFDGPLFVFSWPSQGSVFRYGTDRASADAAVADFADFIGQVADATGAGKIHLIAHSMGNRVLLPGLVKIAGDPAGRLRARIGEVVLAAPAVPEADFAAWLDRIVAHGIDRFTLYASSADVAMKAGWLREWGTTLAGYAANGVPLLHDHVHSIDITKAAAPGLMELNHDVFASNPVMSEDIRQVLQQGSQRPPDRRLDTLKLQRGPHAPLLHWSYEP